MLWLLRMSSEVCDHSLVRWPRMSTASTFRMSDLSFRKFCYTCAFQITCVVFMKLFVYLRRV